MKKLLVGSPVRQKHHILNEFLKGLDEADKTGFEVDYYFVDDNVDEESVALLQTFSKTHNVIIVKGNELVKQDNYNNYVCDEFTHLWNSSLINKVAFFKDTIIEYAIVNDYDYLFFIDSDIVLDRRVLPHLAERKVEIVSNVFWTQWKPNWGLDAQCFWIPGLAEQCTTPFAGPIGSDMARQIQKNFFAKLRVPGIYRVDGLGACTLIERSALVKGARFKEIPNLSILGEDRHFCIRAGALGIDLFIDTVYPVYHIYREQYLDRVDEFKRDGFKYDMCQTFETVAGETREAEWKRLLKKGSNYAGRKIKNKLGRRKTERLCYDHSIENDKIAALIKISGDNKDKFEATVKSILEFTDYFLIFDDLSAEEAGPDYKKLFVGKSFKVHYEKKKPLKDKQTPDQALWEAVKMFNPGWVIIPEAGEIVSEELIPMVKYLIRNKSIDSYRFKAEDNTFIPYLVRYKSDFPYHWNRAGAERYPDDVMEISYADMEIPITKQN